MMGEVPLPQKDLLAIPPPITGFFLAATLMPSLHQNSRGRNALSDKSENTAWGLLTLFSISSFFQAG